MAQADSCTIGEGVQINGRLSGNTPVTVFGRVEGSVDLESDLIVGEGGEVVAQVQATTIQVRGRLNGEVVATDSVTLQAGSVVTGNVRAPRIIIEEGARFKGNIDMDVQL